MLGIKAGLGQKRQFSVGRRDGSVAKSTWLLLQRTRVYSNVECKDVSWWFGFVLVLWDRVSLCRSSSPGTHSVDQSDLNHAEIPLPLLCFVALVGFWGGGSHDYFKFHKILHLETLALWQSLNSTGGCRCCPNWASEYQCNGPKFFCYSMPLWKYF